MLLHLSRSSAMATSVAALLALASPGGVGIQPAFAAGLFTGFEGDWSGDGTLTLAGGTSESIRCRATYEVENDGNKLKQELRCASDSYTLTVESNVSYNSDAGVISGTWHETGYSTGGFLNGNASAGRIDARVDGNGFSASVEITTTSNQQVVTIRPQNMDVTEVSVTMRRT